MLLAEGSDLVEERHHGTSAILAELAADEVHRLDAVGALIDHRDAGIAHELRHPRFLDIAVAAEHLLGLDGVVEAKIGQDAFRDRGHQAHMVVCRLPFGGIG